ncbi:hypothetical protein M514_10835 [Trichuris suis]|uniref:Uncharacterized protein n=1 Tax=Trichuris suis TaxID=68888 RepID=A0A085N1E2_9BILA|nr:hypothetical protein M513_10835 [Trichuris suis]KFD63288.1 hypothetical protein M514_10835 [Trichuris suis]
MTPWPSASKHTVRPEMPPKFCREECLGPRPGALLPANFPVATDSVDQSAHGKSANQIRCRWRARSSLKGGRWRPCAREALL